MDERPAFVLEAIFNFAILILGIVVIVGSVQLGFGSLKQPGAGLFPFLAGVTIVVAEFVVIVSFIFQKRRQHPAFLLDKSAFKTLAALTAILVGWIVLMPFLGYILVTFAAVLTFAKLLGLEGWMKPLALSAGTSLAIHVLFDRLLYLDLPRGLLG